MSRHPYPGMPPSRWRPVAHSMRELPIDQRWPPRGWTYHGLTAHHRTCTRAMALLIAYADPERDEERARTARELERRALAENLPGALAAVLDAIGDGDTRSIDMRDERRKDSA